MDAAQAIGGQTTAFIENLTVEIAKVKAGVALCSNPIDILLCATKGVKGILTNSKLIVSNVKVYINDMSTEVPALINEVKACL